jgi:hypothetical protein
MELESVLETLVDYCNNTGIGTACEVIAAEDALKRLYKSRLKESEKDMTEVINKGKTAFPIIGQLQDVREVGITMRDYFAAKAMQAIMSSDRYGGVIGVNNYQHKTASDAYIMADAMLKARNEK